MTTIQEWADAHPGTNMKYLKIAGPTGDHWRLAHAWRVGTDEPPQLGLFLYYGDATEGECKTVFTSYEAFMRDWTIRE